MFMYVYMGTLFNNISLASEFLLFLRGFVGSARKDGIVCLLIRVIPLHLHFCVLWKINGELY